MKKILLPLLLIVSIAGFSQKKYGSDDTLQLNQLHGKWKYFTTPLNFNADDSLRLVHWKLLKDSCAALRAAITTSGGSFYDSTLMASTKRLKDTAAAIRAYIEDAPKILEGTYTPTITGVTNITATTAYAINYLRVGNTVTVYGKIYMNVTATGGTSLRISLPIASNFTNDWDAAGSGSPDYGPTSYAASIRADTTNDAASIQMNATGSGGWDLFIHFTYKVLP